ncbi:hypothetical protein N7490_005975 [Penicillium lividum]|nr:hypothetical protein N7490_005975 [Penicillium lividum]
MLISTQPASNILNSPRLSLTGVSSTRVERRLSHTTKEKRRIPAHSWDSHMHVVEPQRFPVSKAAVYQPSVHTLADALAFESTIGVENLVLVQPSIYGTDNSCLLAALMNLGPSRGRGVVVVDPTTKPESAFLDEWHTLGVRGLRVNLQSVGKVMEPTELEETLFQHAKIARLRNWIIEIYLPLKMVPVLESIVPRLGVTVCVDHFGSPDLSLPKGEDSLPFDPYTLPGFQSLISLLQAGNTYIKVSAPYRLTNDTAQHQLKAMAREFLAAAPERTIYATDWPHTRFTGIDINPFTEWCLDLCSDVPGLAEKLFRRNTERMLSVDSC